MWVISGDKRSLINSDHVDTFYIGSDGVSIKVGFTNGSGCHLGRCGSPEECEIALAMIAKAISNSNVFEMPSSSEIRAKMIERTARLHHATGKKTKGHGGS